MQDLLSNLTEDEQRAFFNQFKKQENNKDSKDANDSDDSFHSANSCEH